MKNLLFLSILLLTGCDLFTFHDEATLDTITYRVESQVENPPAILFPTPVTYSIDAEHTASGKAAFLHEYPWEVTIPYFQGPKLFLLASSPEEVTLTILRKDKVIAKAKGNGGGGPGDIIGVITGAESYEIYTHIASGDGGTKFTSNYIGGDPEFVTQGQFEITTTFRPGESLKLSKLDGHGLYGVVALQPRYSLLAGYSGQSPKSLEIQFDME